MERTLLNGLTAAMQNLPSNNFSAEDVNAAAVSAIMTQIGLKEDQARNPRELRRCQDAAFALIEEAVDEILPKKLEAVLGQFAEIKHFDRDAEVVFNIDSIGRNRAKLTISRGARAGIYRAARYDRKYFSVTTHIETVGVYVTLEELILGKISLAELFNNILEGFKEVIYKETFNALASAAPVAGYDRVGGNSVSTAKADLGAAIDKVLPIVKQYGTPSIFGSYEALSQLYNPVAAGKITGAYPNLQDSQDIREYGYIQVYKGNRLIELPNYLIDNTNKTWFYDKSYVFIIPSGAKPVKVALKGEMYIKKLQDATGSETWQAHELIGVGLAMANNFAVIKVTDLD